MRKLPKKFFQRKAPIVAHDLVGCLLVRKTKGEIQRFIIIETEAYDGQSDKASHANKGKTARNKIMFGPAGYFYVYFTYGIHWLLNIVTGEKDYPSAVLIRGLESPNGKIILNGPAKLTKFLGIDKKLNGKPIGQKTGLWFEARQKTFNLKKIKTGSRIGVSYAGKFWAGKKWRFYYHSPKK